jgi:cytochrome c-type biogenesis protein CcmH
MAPTTKPTELQRQLDQLDELGAAGALTAEQVREAKARLRDAPGAAPATAPPATAPPAARPSRRLVAGIAALAVVFAAAGYALLGTPEGWRVAPGDTAAAPTTAAPHAGDAQTQAMLARLKERLEKNPDDAEGWSMLGRSYLVLGRHAEAVEALEKLRALRPDDAQVYADLADARAMVAGRQLAGEPEKLVQRALELDPRNLKALALAGTAAFDRGDYVAAVRHWENAVAAGDQNSELVANLRAGIDEARKRGGLAPATPAPQAAAAPPPAPQAAASPGAQVSGKVMLASALQDKAAPDDTLFVFARAVEGSRMPIALLRRRVGDLPLEFTLDDSSAMSPALKLSGAVQVVVGARITKSGNAIAQPGDLQGFSPPVAVGTRGLRIEIADVVK